MLKNLNRGALCLVLLMAISPAWAGKGAFLPTYHPKPCSGDDCKADDPRSGLPCKGLLCGFTSAKSMQPPVTAAQAAEAEKARDAAIAAAAAAVPAPPVKSKHRRVAKIKIKTKATVAASDAATVAQAPAK